MKPRRRIPAARVAAAIQRVNAADTALIQQINDLAAEIHRLRAGIEPPPVADRAARIEDLEARIEALYAQRRHLAARATAEALQPPPDRAD